MRKIFCIQACSAILGESIGNGRGNNNIEISSITDQPVNGSAHFFEIGFPLYRAIWAGVMKNY